MITTAVTLEKGSLPDWAKNKQGFAQFDVKSTVAPYRKIAGTEDNVRDANVLLDNIEGAIALLRMYAFSGTFIISLSDEKQALTGQGIILGEEDYRNGLCLFGMIINQVNKLLSIPLRLCQVSIKYSQLATLRK